MGSVSFAWLAGALVALLLIVGWWRKRRDAGNGAAQDGDRIDTLIGWPPQATRVLNHPERAAFALLVRALPDYMILAQVPLSRFLNVPKRHSYADWLRRLGYQCVDFAVCDMNAQVVAVIELQPPTPRVTERARKRLARMARTLKAAKIPLQVWAEQSLPTAESVRELIMPRPPVQTLPTAPSVAAAAAAPSASAAPPAPAARNPFDDTARDSTQDEHIELLEPPPSTWFDDMDSEPVPLAKPKR